MEEDIVFGPIEGHPDLPEQAVVDDEKILQEIEDFEAYKKMKQNEALGI